MATPLVRIPQPRGGTMYAFASAARDMTRAFNNPDLNFNFSHYALLDLPDFKESTQDKNTIDFGLNLVDTSGNPYINVAPNVDFAQTFQNYVLNAEELLLKNPDYNPLVLQSDSEKLFFKWLNSVGAIKFRSADSNEATNGALVEDENGNYSKVIKYIGTIDVENDIAYKENAYHEVYINVPASVGNTPTVLFKQKQYNTNLSKLYANEIIEGREGQQHPDPNINLNSLVDTYDSLTENAYYDIEPNSTNNLHVVFDDSYYSQIVNNSNIQNIFDFSKTGQQFTFNAILVYYDVYSDSNPLEKATNLYGILILDEIQSSGGPGSKIREQIKFKADDVSGLNGNAFSLKLNLKFNSSISTVGVETSVNDFTTFSMDLFMDTTSALKNAVELLIESNEKYLNVVNRLDNIENLVISNQTSEDLILKISEIEDQLQNASLQLNDADALLQLITKAHDRINSIIDGTIPTEIQYNTDVIFSGPGIKINKENPQKIKIINDVNGYSINSVFKWDQVGSPIRIDSINKFDIGAAGAGAQSFAVYTRLLNYTNRLSLQNILLNDPNDDLDIYIDDSSVAWKIGQTFKISFDDINLNGNSIKIYTGKVNEFNNLIKVIEPVNLMSNKPYIEIVCIDPINYIFEVDILR